jgi:hypothetical protein
MSLKNRDFLYKKNYKHDFPVITVMFSVFFLKSEQPVSRSFQKENKNRSMHVSLGFKAHVRGLFLF